MTHQSDDLAASLAMLERLVGFDTVSAKTNLPLIEAVEGYLADYGIAFTRVPNAAGDKAALFVTVGPAQDGGVLLSGHTDVVPVEGQPWTSDPFRLRREGSRLYGRGACDMKSFDAICLAMLPAFQKAALRKPVHLLLSYDEEIGCLGSLDAIRRFGVDLPRPAIVIVGEPTQMVVVDAHKSISAYETTVLGKEAHSSKPDLGASAVEAACDLVSELCRLADQLREEGDPSGRFDPGFSTIHVGKIMGGTARNIVARRCVFNWEFRGLPDAERDRALHHMEAYAERVLQPKLARRGGCVEIETRSFTQVPSLAAKGATPAETLAKRLTRSNAVGTVAFGTEGGHFQAADIPTVICGPGNIDQAHAPDEFIELAQVEAGIAFMRRLMAELS